MKAIHNFEITNDNEGLFDTDAFERSIQFERSPHNLRDESPKSVTDLEDLLGLSTSLRLTGFSNRRPGEE